jgi:hypothetical protein
MSAKLHFLYGLIIAAGAIAPLQAFANGSQPLPGVKQPDPIVQAPQPEPDEQQTSKPGTFKVGNFDVKVSGSVTVDIGAGRIKPPR